MKKIAIIFSFILIFTKIEAQNIMTDNLYFRNMNYYNPAAGIEDSTIHYQLLMYGKYKHIENELWQNSIDFFINHIGKIETTSGFYNFSYLFNRYSYFDRHTLSGGYTQVWNWGNGNSINAGIRAVFNFDQVYWERLKYTDISNNNILYFNPDLDLGIRYGNKKLAAGFSLKNVFSNTLLINEMPFIKNYRCWIFDFSYRFEIKGIVSITPYTLMRYERNYAIDLGVNIGYKNIISVGYQLRAIELRHIYTVTGNIAKRVQIGAAFDHSTLFSDLNFDLLVRLQL